MQTESSLISLITSLPAVNCSCWMLSNSDWTEELCKTHLEVLAELWTGGAPLCVAISVLYLPADL